MGSTTTMTTTTEGAGQSWLKLYVTPNAFNKQYIVLLVPDMLQTTTNSRYESDPSSNKGYDCKFENNKDQFVAIVFTAHVSLVTSDQRKQTVNAFTSSKLYYLHKEARFDEAN